MLDEGKPVLFEREGMKYWVTRCLPIRFVYRVTHFQNGPDGPGFYKTEDWLKGAVAIESTRTTQGGE